MRISIYILFLLVTISHSFATPEISLWTNNQCSKCHINIQGGGARNHFGQNFGKESSIISDFKDFDNLFNSSNALSNSIRSYSMLYNYLYKKASNKPDSLFDFGYDLRMQYAKSFKIQDAKWKFFPMQGTIYLSSIPFEWLTLEGSYNFGPIVYQGQKKFSFSSIFNFGNLYPKLKIGYFQPTFGIKDCDMTSLDRRAAYPDGTESIIPPDYFEKGIEAYFSYKEWLFFSLGLFNNESLSEILIGNKSSLVSNKNSPLLASKLVFFPSWLIEDFNDSYIGASILINDDFKILNLFSGISFDTKYLLYLKYIYSFKPNTLPFERKINNLILGVNYIPSKGINFGLRSEIGNSDWIYSFNERYSINTVQLIFNIKLMPIPFIELIPEYKIIKSEEYLSSRFLFQLHFYY